jgi:hypothetical protein
MTVNQNRLLSGACWFTVVGMTVAFAVATTWLAAPERAKVIQVLFPFPLTILGSWFLTMMSLNIARLLFAKNFDIKYCAAFSLIAVPIAWSGMLEEIPGLISISARISPTLIQALPIPALILCQLFVPRHRSVDRILFAGLGGVVAGIHILFHIALTIPEADISRQRQIAIMELLSEQPSDALVRNAPRHGGILLSNESLRDDEAVANFPPEWGEGASVVAQNIRRILNDAPETAYVSVEPGNTIFERIGYLYDGRALDTFTEPRVFLFPSTATNASLMNAQRAHFTLAGIGSAFWFLAVIFLAKAHRKPRRSVSP